MKDNTDSGLPPVRSFFWQFMNAAPITEGALSIKTVVHHVNETIKLLYVSRSAADIAHCLFWIDWSQIEPLHFWDFSIFHYAAFGIKICLVLPRIYVARLVFWLPDDIDTRVATYQAHFNPALIAAYSAKPSAFNAFDCSGTHPPIKKSNRLCIGFFF